MEKAFGSVEVVLDTLIEVGICPNDEELHDAVNKLFGLRYFLISVFQPDKMIEYDKMRWEKIKCVHGIDNNIQGMIK